MLAEASLFIFHVVVASQISPILSSILLPTEKDRLSAIECPVLVGTFLHPASPLVRAPVDAECVFPAQIKKQHILRPSTNKAPAQLRNDPF
jgi:hypothetical protein